MSVKSMAYDNPAYLARMPVALGVNLTGSGTSPVMKFVAFSNMTLFSVTAMTYTLASTTSTYTAWNGTATITAVSADSFTVQRISNNGTLTAAALTTTTFGPFVVAPYNGTSTGTQTSTAGVYVNVALSAGTSTATTGNLQAGSPGLAGGLNILQGDMIQIIRGTDASAVTGFGLEVGLTPLSNVTQ